MGSSDAEADNHSTIRAPVRHEIRAARVAPHSSRQHLVDEEASPFDSDVCKIQCTLDPVGEFYNGPNEEKSDQQPPIAPVAAQRSPAQGKHDKGIRHHDEQRVGIGGRLEMNNHPDDDLRDEQRDPGENQTNNDPECIHRRPPLAKIAEISDKRKGPREAGWIKPMNWF